MGVDCYAYCTFGLLVEKEQLLNASKSLVKPSPGCNHHPLPQSSMFCPSCGKPAFVKEEVDIYEIIEELEKKGFDVSSSTDSYEIVIGINLASSGSIAEAAKSEKFSILTPVEHARITQELQRTVAPYKIWNPEMVGYWLIPKCSY